ncbi:SIMPL domain-containing protein [Aureimonas mangrovi]|uniref:SIMPL domain-containing protein n=1 Tax=Aureimonas mangrovi TaxID=2758041 RepID=UPI001FE6E848|nr:SIMPL domain-containing protein [Aureimonas mangrovi]
MAMPRPLSLLAFILLASGPALAQPADRGPGPRDVPRVTVVGEGEAHAAPDLAVTNLTVLRTAETAEAAVTDANGAIAAVTDAVREMGIESRDVQTGRFSITPQYRYENRQDGTSAPPELVGYEVRNTLTVRVRDLDRLGDLLDRAVELGVNEGGDIAFQIEDPSSLQNEARRQAVERARASAEVLADAAGQSLGRIIRITDDPVRVFPQPERGQMMMAARAADASVPIEAGENTVNARVEVVFELSDDTAE